LLSPAGEKKPEAAWVRDSGLPGVASWCPEPDSNRHTFWLRDEHYPARPLDLLCMWHSKIEGWILERAGIEPPQEDAKSGLAIVA
jgi:hypothetical protein